MHSSAESEDVMDLIFRVNPLGPLFHEYKIKKIIDH